MTTGEGGIVVTGSDEEWRAAQEPRQPGPGGLGRLARARAARLQLPALGRRGGARRRPAREARPAAFAPIAAAARYAELLEGVAGAEPLLADDEDHTRSWFVYPVRLAPEIDREHVIAELERVGIQTSRYLPSIHLQSYMRERFGFREGMCPVSEEASRRLVSIPFHSGIEAEAQERVIEALAQAL